MSRTDVMLAIGLAAIALLLGPGSMSEAAAQSPACATTEPPSPANPSPGTSCWTETAPYPFGSDGDPVGPKCAQSDIRGCALRVTSLAFRAPNRGVAATRTHDSTPTPHGVWLFNGIRWYPDAGFPGSATCGGDTVLWAGKLDFWLVGAKPWGALCRFDGSTFTWQPMAVPRDTLAGLQAGEASPPTAGIQAGSCFAWNDCWFFGSYGAVLRWDGSTLKDASPDRFAQPWLRTSFTAAVARSDQSGRFAVAVGTSGDIVSPPEGAVERPVAPRQPSMAPPPQMFALGGDGFAALGFTPPTIPRDLDPYRTDIVAVDFSSQRRGWIAADPRLRRIPALAREEIPPPEFPDPAGTPPQPAPLLALTPSGEPDPACAGPAANRFTHTRAPSGTKSYLWSSIAVLPGSGSALAGGRMRPGVAGPGNDDGWGEPLLARVDCDGTVTETRFRVPDPTQNPATAALVPANRGGSITSVVVTASNEAWAATSDGELRPVTGRAQQQYRLYRLTDGAKPDAEPGDDVEDRPPEVVIEAPLFIEEPAPEDPPAPADVTETEVIEARAPPRTPRQLAAIYAINPSKPRRITRGRDRGRFLLSIRFKLRREVTVGLRGLRRRKIVTSSGLKRFTGRQGRLTITLDRRRWPTKLSFYYPAPRSSQDAVEVPRVATEPAR